MHFTIVRLINLQIISTVLLILFYSEAPAQSVKKAVVINEFSSGSVIVSYNKQTTEYKFKSFQDLAEGLESIGNEIITNTPHKSKDACEESISVHIEQNKEGNTVEIKSCIKTNCSAESRVVAISKLNQLIKSTLE